MSNTSNTEQIAIQVANDQQVAVAIAFTQDTDPFAEPEPNAEPDTDLETHTNFFNTNSFSSDDGNDAEEVESRRYPPTHVNRHRIILSTIEGKHYR